MKILWLICILVCSALSIEAQPGKYAGSKKDLIGTEYTNSRTIKGLSGWSFREGSVLSALRDPEMILVDVYKKGSVYLVFFSIAEDTLSPNFKVVDAIEIKPVTKGWTIETSFCTKDGIENPWIVAWTKISPTEYMKSHKKAWQFNRDKRIIEPVSTKGIACLNEGFDLQ